MGRPLTTLFKAAALQLERNTAMVLLVELPLADVDGFPAGQVARLARSSRHISAGGHTYQASAIKVSVPGEEGQGRLGSGSLTIANASRLPGQMVEQGRIVGQKCTLRFALQDERGGHVCTLDPAAQFDCRVKRAAVTAAGVVLELGHVAEGLRCPEPLFERRTFPSMLPMGGAA